MKVVKKQRLTVSATPDSVTATSTDGLPLPSYLIRLHGPDEGPILIEGIDADHPGFVCTWAQGPENMATVKIAFDQAKLDAEDIRARLYPRVQADAADVDDSGRLYFTIVVVSAFSREPRERSRGSRLNADM